MKVSKNPQSGSSESVGNGAFWTGNGAYLNQIPIYDLGKLQQSPDVTRQLKIVPTPLDYVPPLGLTENVSLLVLGAGLDANARGGECGTAPYAAQGK